MYLAPLETMLVPIVCFTCGLPLGDVAPIYRIIRTKRMIKRFGQQKPQKQKHKQQKQPKQKQPKQKQPKQKQSDQQLLKKQLNSRVNPALVPIDPSQDENMMGDVLDALRITKCCRTHMITAVDFREYY